MSDSIVYPGAQERLEAAGVGRAWDIHVALMKKDADRKAFTDAHGWEAARAAFPGHGYEEMKIHDIVSRLVAHGDLSNRQAAYLAVLIKKIDAREPHAG